MVLSKAALAGAVALVLSTAAYGTETFPETLRGGQDKAAYHAAQIDLHKRLTSVGLKPAKPILVEVTRQDRIDMGEIASSESGPQAKERRMLVGVTKQYDYNMVQAIMIVYALIIVIVNIIVDLIYTWVDPRVRYS